MQQRAGLLYYTHSGRILLILEDGKWTVPTFPRQGVLLKDVSEILKTFSEGRILPIELYTSTDKGFEYGTYVCLVAEEFIPRKITFCWADLKNLPKQMHSGLRLTLNNEITKTKLETILAVANDT